MELDSVKLYETVVAAREDPKEICQMEERIEREQNELQWIESTSRLAKFLTTRGLNGPFSEYLNSVSFSACSVQLSFNQYCLPIPE